MILTETYTHAVTGFYYRNRNASSQKHININYVCFVVVFFVSIVHVFFLHIQENDVVSNTNLQLKSMSVVLFFVVSNSNLQFKSRSVVLFFVEYKRALKQHVHSSGWKTSVS